MEWTVGAGVMAAGIGAAAGFEDVGFGALTAGGLTAEFGWSPQYINTNTCIIKSYHCRILEEI